MAQLDYGISFLLIKLLSSPALSISLCVLQHIQLSQFSLVGSNQELCASLTSKRRAFAIVSLSLTNQFAPLHTLQTALY